MANRKKKPVEYYFIDMNDPSRYKKLKVSRACDFCRQRKSKCDIGIPGSGVCSNCRKANVICVFSNNSKEETSNLPDEGHGYSLDLSVEPSVSPLRLEQRPLDLTLSKNALLMRAICDQFPVFGSTSVQNTNNVPPIVNSNAHAHWERISQDTQHVLFQAYTRYVHPYFPVLHEQPSTLSVYSALFTLLYHICPAELSNLPTPSNYYQQAHHIDQHSLSAVQTLLLLHKYQEITVCAPSPTYLEQASVIVEHLQENRDTCIVRWVLYVSMALLGQQTRSVLCEQWMTSYNERRLFHDIQYLVSNDTLIMTNFVELAKLAMLHNELTTCVFTPTIASKLKQSLVYWKLALPRHLYTNNSTLGDYDAFFSTCLLLLSDCLSLRLSMQETTPLEERSTLSECLATAARIQQSVYTLISTGFYMVAGQPVLLLALKLATTDLIETYATWVAFEEDSGGTIQWLCDWLSHSAFLCEKLDMTLTTSLNALREAILQGKFNNHEEEVDDVDQKRDPQRR
ncbi:hypothetical protein BJV82DRAFT_287256 [Fennellomyces sp. T-0311]|nr:hypothetical protein BJV82DRAFT_287256 [Fennellomyces sp. T-0311]